jgi:hypothetical protein
MATQTAIDESKARAAIDAVKDRKRGPIEQADLTRRSRATKLRRKLSKDLQPLWSGVDVAKIDHALQAHHAELRETLAREKQATAGQMAEMAELQLRGLANARSALEHIGFKPYLITPILVPTPFMIGARPAGFLTDSLALPWSSWAKASLILDQNTSASTARISFYFLWRNPANYLAVLNCTTGLSASGGVELDAQPGFFSGGNVSLHLHAELNVFVGNLEISWQATQKSDIVSLSADGGNFLGYGDIVNQTISSASDLRCNSIEVAGDQIVVFEVALVADYTIDDGHIAVDFTSDLAILCPVLNIELLTPPPAPPITPI